MTVLDEPRCLLLGAQVCVCQAEGTHAGRVERIAFSRASPDGVVLHQNHPSMMTGIRQPGLVSNELPFLLAIDGRDSVDDVAVNS